MTRGVVTQLPLGHRMTIDRGGVSPHDGMSVCGCGLSPPPAHKSPTPGPHLRNISDSHRPVSDISSRRKSESSSSCESSSSSKRRPRLFQPALKRPTGWRLAGATTVTACTAQWSARSRPLLWCTRCTPARSVASRKPAIVRRANFRVRRSPTPAGVLVFRCEEVRVRSRADRKPDLADRF